MATETYRGRNKMATLGRGKNKTQRQEIKNCDMAAMNSTIYIGFYMMCE